MLDRRVRPVLDLAGLALFAVVLLATLRSTSANGGDARAVVGVVAVSFTALVVGRLIGEIKRVAVPALLAVAGAALAIVAWDQISSQAPLAGPFGYANATAAFFDQIAIAGAMTAVATRMWVLRVLGLAAAAVAVAASLAVGSLAGVILLGLVGFAVVATAGPRASRASVIALSILFIAVLATTLVVAARPESTGAIGSAVEQAVTERRTTLWTDAYATMIEHPSMGVGPGEAWRYSEIGRTDIDAREAHHVFLQFGAETGVVGFVALVLLFLWGFARLAIVGHPDAVTVLGAVSLAVLGIHGSIDWVLNVAAVPAAAALLVGVAQVPPPSARKQT